MASIYEVSRIINAIATGLEDECLKCMDENKDIVESLVREQLYSGLNGKERLLSPTYDNDPYFEEHGHWFHRSKQYKYWKLKKTPPIESEVLFLPPRPSEVPNLFITGTFHESITAHLNTSGLLITTIGFVEGPNIERKYGADIFMLGETGRRYFNNKILRPWLKRFFNECGYK